MALLDDALIAAWLPGAAADRAATLADVLDRYGEPNRRYHGVLHVRTVVSRVVSLMDDAGPRVGDPASVVWAALWHDAIYDPRSSTNEADSAVLASETLAALGVRDTRLGEVERLILLTAGHRVSDDDPAGAILVDADLAVLGADPSAYASYVAGVRAEYHFVSDAGWRTGRAAVLRGLLGLPRIFTTETMCTYEAAGRRNLTKELASLEPA
jgi:predicted metal-dependent HD superfamily phosphohydrolase